MKKVSRSEFEAKLREKLIEANFNLRKDMLKYFETTFNDNFLLSKLKSIYKENAYISFKEERPICQDTGYVQLFIKIGNNVFIDFDLEEVVNKVVSHTYEEKYLRKSMAHPITRKNTGDNTPAFIDYDFYIGDELIVDILVKGGGSENVTKADLLLPTITKEELENWITEQMSLIGAKACPPYIVGVGIGGNLEKALYFSKKLLLHHIGENFMSDEEKNLSVELKEKFNSLGIGFQGLKVGDFVLDVRVKMIPCHIATFPVAISVGCNAVRQAHFRI